MIRGIHAMLYTDEAEALRAFLRDKIGLPCSDVGDGWLIFDVSEGELGCHPPMEGQPRGMHDVSFYCDDIEETVTDLKRKGVAFKGDIEDRGWGLGTEILAPGGVTITLYQPRYTKG